MDFKLSKSESFMTLKSYGKIGVLYDPKIFWTSYSGLDLAYGWQLLMFNKNNVCIQLEGFKSL